MTTAFGTRSLHSASARGTLDQRKPRSVAGSPGKRAPLEQSPIGCGGAEGRPFEPLAPLDSSASGVWCRPVAERGTGGLRSEPGREGARTPLATTGQKKVPGEGSSRYQARHLRSPPAAGRHELRHTRARRVSTREAHAAARRQCSQPRVDSLTAPRTRHADYFRVSGRRTGAKPPRPPLFERTSRRDTIS